MLHRDLKPANVMITTDGIVKILDFGLAKRFGAAEGDATALLSMTDSGSMVGTVAYMAPEQTMGHGADVRSDVFSFGVMFYEMLAGERPFDGGNVISTIRRINGDEPRPLRVVRPDLPAAVEEIVTSALRKDANQRTARARRSCARDCAQRRAIRRRMISATTASGASHESNERMARGGRGGRDGGAVRSGSVVATIRCGCVARSSGEG